MSTDFQRNLASSFSSIGDVAALARAGSPISALGFGRSDLSSILRPRLPIDLGPIVTAPEAPQAPPPTTLTPIDAGVFIHTIAQTPEQTMVAAVHAARTAFEAIPTAQNGDVIDASIPNGFRSGMITLLSLAEATIHQLFQQQPRPIPLPVPVPPTAGPPPVTITPPVTSPPPVVGPPVVGPPFVIDPGIIHIDPSVIGPLVGRPDVVDPGPGMTTITPPGGEVAPTPGLPTIDLGGRVFDAQTFTHPETGATTTVFVERPEGAATGATVGMTPVAGGGFHFTPAATELAAGAGTAGMTAAAGATEAAGAAGAFGAGLTPGARTGMVP